MYPQDVEFKLKKGAQVMFTKNYPSPEKLFVNGTIDEVVASSVDFDDKAKKKLNRQYFPNFTIELFTKLFLWNYSCEGFDLERHLEQRALL